MLRCLTKSGLLQFNCTKWIITKDNKRKESSHCVADHETDSSPQKGQMLYPCSHRAEPASINSVSKVKGLLWRNPEHKHVCWSLAHAEKHKREVREGELDFKQILATAGGTKELCSLAPNLARVRTPCSCALHAELAGAPHRGGKSSVWKLLGNCYTCWVS